MIYHAGNYNKENNNATLLVSLTHTDVMIFFLVCIVYLHLCLNSLNKIFDWGTDIDIELIFAVSVHYPNWCFKTSEKNQLYLWNINQIDYLTLYKESIWMILLKFFLFYIYIYIKLNTYLYYLTHHDFK